MSDAARLNKVIVTEKPTERKNFLITSRLGLGGAFNLLLKQLILDGEVTYMYSQR
jgi:hypothetical protein